MEAMERGFEDELNGKGIGGTDNTVQLSVSARKDQEVRMETQAEYKPTTKECTKCGEDKPFNEFSKSAMGKYGHRSICKVCDCAACNKRSLKKRMLKNAKAAVKAEQPIAPGSTVLKKLVDKARAANKGGTPAIGRTVEPNGRAKILADEHWAYIRSLLVTHGDDGDPDELAKIEFHYKSAMIHGYKHGVDDRERAIQS
jgi:hypothetical protein